MIEPFKTGDIIANVDFSPVYGHEQAKSRPAIIVSSNAFSARTGMYIVAPISSNVKPFPTHVMLDKRTATHGAIFVEHLRAVDLKARKARKKEECPPDILREVMVRVAAIFPDTYYDNE